MKHVQKNDKIGVYIDVNSQCREGKEHALKIVNNKTQNSYLCRFLALELLLPEERTDTAQKTKSQKAETGTTTVVEPAEKPAKISPSSEIPTSGSTRHH